MRTQDRAHLTLALRELLEAVGVLFEDTATCDQAPELLAPAKLVQAAADEVFDRVRLLAVPATLVFAGGNVVLADLPERSAAEDKQAQRDMSAQQHRRADELEAAVPGLLDDTEPVFSAERDNRRSA